MDILTHTLSGLAIGTVVASFSNKGAANKLAIVLISGLAAAIPDLDAISLWSGFDTTIGSFFNLPYSGKEIYSGQLWYSHHGFLHSLFAALLIADLIGFFTGLLQCKLKNITIEKLFYSYKTNALLLIGFVLGFSIHLLEDMPTPASSWGGVNFLWPSKTYMGGTGDIWWWNNYDIFLIVLGVSFINLLLPFIKKIISFDLRKVAIGVFIVGFALVLIQIKTRDYDFAYAGHTDNYHEFEAKSKALQKDILGDKIYHIMEKLDNKLPIYF